MKISWPTPGARLALLSSMAWSPSAAYDQGGGDFDAGEQLAILRRAVAGIVLPGKHLPSGLAAIRMELLRFCALGQVVVALLGNRELVATVSELEARLARGLPNRAMLELVRGDLYDCLISASQLLAAEAVPAAASAALSMRALLSDFCGALLPVTDDELWPLTVAAGELSLLLRQPGLKQWPARQRSRLTLLGARVRRWQARGSSRTEARELYAEVASTLDLLDSLNHRPDVRRHDERLLRELLHLLSRPTHDLSLAVCAAERLAALRGLDRELDRLIVALPLEPVLSLDGIARRISKLCLATAS
jgi:hypothetical protein